MILYILQDSDRHYSQSPDQFYGVYPKVNSIQLVATGNGTVVHLLE